MNLQVEKILFSKRKKEIKQIYTTAFPKEDRMPFGMMLAMSCLWNTEFLAFYDEDILCGFIYLASIGKTTFIMFFAIDESLRSKGYGSEILAEVKRLHPNNKIVVSIEPCDEDALDLDLRIRRKEFYQRNGYVEADYYLSIMGGKKQELLINNGEFKKSSFILFFMLYSNCAIIPRVWRKEQNISKDI